VGLVERGVFKYLQKMGKGSIRRSEFLNLSYPELDIDWDLVNLVLGDWREIVVSDFMVSVIYSEKSGCINK